MAKIFLIDDDRAVTDMLKRIIEKTDSGQVCGSYNNPAEALENIVYDDPDIVLCDFLMPETDGITFVREGRKLCPNAAFVMLSQVSDKHLMGEAYSAGIEFFISKPINSIEVVSVINNVYEKLRMKSVMDQMTRILSPQTDGRSAHGESRSTRAEWSGRLRKILTKIGIMGQKGADDIINLCEYYFDHDDELGEIKLKDICSSFSESPKSMEQRIRRAAAMGMVNMANLGIEDYYNDIFTTYAAPLFGFDQVRAEMNYIQGKSDTRGNVKVRRFITALVYASQEK